MRVLFDVSRTLARRFSTSPTGIERVEHAFVRWLLARRHALDLRFVATAPPVQGVLGPAAMTHILDAMERRWTAHHPVSGADEFARLRRALCETTEVEEPPRAFRAARSGTSASDLRAEALLFTEALRGARELRSIVGEADRVDTLFVHTSHSQLEFPDRFAWSTGGPLRRAFFVHDIIPIDHPEFCRPGAAALHNRRMRTVADLAHVVVANSGYTRDRLKALFAAHGWVDRPIVASPLATADPGEVDDPLPPLTPRKPYFLVVGTLEGRKNLLFLLAVWRRMVERFGPEETPFLVVAGNRGWNCRDVFDLLDNAAWTPGVVFEASGLNDREIRALMRSATACLAPSSVEGFSLPPIEAAALGTPVIASDIDVHREVLGASATLVDPIDGEGWVAAVRAAAGRRLRPSPPPTPIAGRSWDTFAEETFTLMNDLAR